VYCDIFARIKHTKEVVTIREIYDHMWGIMKQIKNWEQLAQELGCSVEDIEVDVFESAAALGARRIARGDGEVIKFEGSDGVCVYVSRKNIEIERVH
jgi:hypothetical protein